MADSNPHSASSSATEEAPPEKPKPFEALRSLLLRSEQEQIHNLRERLTNPELHAQDVSSVVAEAIRLRREKKGDHALAEALGPSVEEVLRESIRKDPHTLADALFPVMGPAIRKSIAESLRSMLQAFNEALEHSLSIQGLKWRIEAIRTGRSFAEVVLLHSLIYRVEQIFLIHRKTSLLLQHVVAPAVAVQDADMVSGMLSAIQDFVRDSFKSAADETLDTLQVGDLQVWVEQGPQAILAAVIRGNAPQDLRFMLKERLEEVHQKFGGSLEEFEGNAAPFEAYRGGLEQCLEARFKGESRAKPRPYFWLLAILLLSLLAGWKIHSILRDREWNRFVDNLRQQPGLVVTSVSWEGGRYHIRGLRDPLAVTPDALLMISRLDSRLADFQLRTFYSTDDALVLKRAERILQPPHGVTLSIYNGVLRAAGQSPPGWARTMRERAALIAGLTGVDESALDDADSLAHNRALMQSATILFAVGSSAITTDQASRIQEIAEAVRKLATVAEQNSSRVLIEAVGHADTLGSEGTNSQLSQQRARQVVSALARTGFDAKLFRVRGAGITEPVRPEVSEADRRFNRSVTFRVIVSPAASGP